MNYRARDRGRRPQSRGLPPDFIDLIGSIDFIDFMRAEKIRNLYYFR